VARGLGKITDRIQDKNNKKLSPLALSSPRVFKILVIEENSKELHFQVPRLCIHLEVFITTTTIMMTYSFMCVNKAIPIHASTEFTAFRDFQNFKKRRGDLPTQLEGDAVDVRGLMHRDGSVFSTVSLEDLRNPNQLYVSLGAKTLFGLPFKDIATSDSIYLPEVPPVEDAASRRTLKRLQEAGVGVLADIEKLVLTPIDNSVTITPHTSLSAGLPALTQGSIRG